MPIVFITSGVIVVLLKELYIGGIFILGTVPCQVYTLNNKN